MEAALRPALFLHTSSSAYVLSCFALLWASGLHMGFACLCWAAGQTCSLWLLCTLNAL